MRAEWMPWELAGVPLIFLAGSALHFAYAWCGRRLLVAPFVPVNESVWEHLKMAFWPAVLYGAVEYAVFGRGAAGFALAKSASLLAMPLCVLVLFYTYTALLGRHILWADILVFLVAVGAGQALGCFILVAEPSSAWAGGVGLAAVVLLGLCFVLFTFRPPRLPLFRDKTTGGYGLPYAGPAA